MRAVGKFVDLTLSRVPSGIAVPEPLRMLFEWVETNGFVQRGKDGDLYGSLSATWPGRGRTSCFAGTGRTR